MWCSTQMKFLLCRPGILEAGVSSVLVSIPEAEGTSARSLCVHYHERRVSGESPLFAFQSAQKRLAGQNSTANLGRWIGFTLYGCI